MTVPVILCVDDEEDVLHALRRVFLDDPYRVLTATSGREGLELLDRDEVEVILSDYVMPEMSGPEFLARAREQRPGAVRLIISGSADASQILELVHKNVAYGFVEKPWRDDELRLLVSRALELAETRRHLTRLEREVCEGGAALTQLEQILGDLPWGLLAIDAGGVVRWVTRPDLLAPCCATPPAIGAPLRAVLLPEVAALVERTLAGVPSSLPGGSAPRVICVPRAGGRGVLLLVAPFEALELDLSLLRAP